MQRNSKLRVLRWRDDENIVVGPSMIGILAPVCAISMEGDLSSNFIHPIKVKYLQKTSPWREFIIIAGLHVTTLNGEWRVNY